MSTSPRRRPLKSLEPIQPDAAPRGTSQGVGERKDRFRSLAENLPDMIVRYDRNLRRTYVNPAWERVTGMPAAEALGYSPGERPGLLPSTSSQYEDHLQRALDQGIPISIEVIEKGKDGTEVLLERRIVPEFDGKGTVVSLLAITRDITERKKAQEEIHSLAFYDSLTKLPNRWLFLDRLNLALAHSTRSNMYGVVLFLDLDRFKQINDSFGHSHGDLLLIKVAERIRSCIREVDTVARLGGDEFVVLVGDLGVEIAEVTQKVARIARKIRSTLAQPYILDQHIHHSSPSIGVCLFKGTGDGLDALLKHADVAMYQAKEAGGNTVRFFDPVMQQNVEARNALEFDLRQALAEDQFRLYYQVQVDHAHRPRGAEALIRWNHPTRGLVSPSEFIPMAEESSLILEIGHWVLNTASRQLAAWARHPSTHGLELAVNVSAKQFSQSDFVAEITTLVRKHRIDPTRLKLELTERVLLDNVEDVAVKMHELKAVGVKLSLDDFGTGYSSLSYLKRLPLDQLKIDQSFVQNITAESRDATLVRTIIDLTNNFGLDVIAEGVETEAQLGFLKDNKCMAYQGYLFGRPMPSDAFSVLLARLNDKEI